MLQVRTKRKILVRGKIKTIIIQSSMQAAATHIQRLQNIATPTSVLFSLRKYKCYCMSCKRNNSMKMDFAMNLQAGLNRSQ